MRADKSVLHQSSFESESSRVGVTQSNLFKNDVFWACIDPMQKWLLD